MNERNCKVEQKQVKFDFDLKRNIVFLDLETTGTNFFYDRIIEISVVKLFTDKSSEIKTKRLNPERHIPAEATAIHGITDDDVKNELTFKAISSSLLKYLDECDLGGFNVNKFDIPMLCEEFKRAGLEFSLAGRNLIDVQTIFHKMEPRTLSAAYRYYCGKELDGAHSAEADTLAAVEILGQQLRKYESIPKEFKELSDFCSYKDANAIDSTGKFKWASGIPVVSFGKNDGIPLREIAENKPDFLKWMINASFPEDAVEIARNALQGKFPEPK